MGISNINPLWERFHEFAVASSHFDVQVSQMKDGGEGSASKSMTASALHDRLHSSPFWLRAKLCAIVREEEHVLFFS